MDLSKLPKLSESDPPPPASSPTSSPAQSAAYSTPAQVLPVNALPSSSYAEAWISGIVGLICVMIGKQFSSFLIAKISGHAFHTGVIWQTGDLAGQEVAYSELQGFVMLNDAAFFLFGLALIFDALVIVAMLKNFRFGRPLLWLAFLTSTAAICFNLYVVVKLFSADVLPIISMLVIAFGGYIAATQWKILQRSR